MPLGNFLKLLAKAFQQMPPESDSVSELSNTTEEFTETPTPSIVNIVTLEEKAMINISMLQDELQNFVSGSSDVQGAALVSPDGLALASVLPAGMDEERTAAMSASMLSLGERIGRELARGNVDRIVVEGEKGIGLHARHPLARGAVKDVVQRPPLRVPLAQPVEAVALPQNVEPVMLVVGLPDGQHHVLGRRRQ